MNHSKLQKLSLLAPILLSRPSEAWDRLAAIAQVSLESWAEPPMTLSAGSNEEAVSRFTQACGVTPNGCFQDPALAALEQEIECRIASLRAAAPFKLQHNADRAFARFAYLACRTLKPEVVVETGVAYGITTACVLQALAQNRKGRLISVDLPPLAPRADRHVGLAVPDQLRDRWQLRRGPSKRLLPALLASLPALDIFIHDSLHTRRNMLFEFNLAWPKLRPPGLLLSDDVAGNRAFQRFLAHVQPASWCVVREHSKDSAFGFMLKQ